MKRNTSPASAVVIADLVSSRAVVDRRALHERLLSVLASAEHLGAVSPLRVTVGDEFQGAYAGVGEALHATLWLRLALLTGEPGVDVRFGIGWGEVTQVDAARGIEDGPAWWAARDAIDAVEVEATRAGLRHRRTAYRSAPGVDTGPDPALVEALLVCRDQVAGPLSVRSARVLLGLLEGRTQLELAETEGISASAVSQRVRGDGLAALVAAEGLLTQI